MKTSLATRLSVTGQTWPHPTGSTSLSQYPSVVTISMQRHKSIFSRNTGDQRILQSDLKTAFWPISSIPEFSLIWSLHRKKENNKIFRNRVLSARHYEKKFTKILKKKKLFLKNLALQLLKGCGSLTSCTIFRKTNE